MHPVFLLIGCQKSETSSVASLNIQVTESQFDETAGNKSAFSKMSNNPAEEVEIPWDDELFLSVKIKSSSDIKGKIAPGNALQANRKKH